MSVNIDYRGRQIPTFKYFIIQIRIRVLVIDVGYSAGVVHLTCTVWGRIQGHLEEASVEGEPESVVRCFIEEEPTRRD